MEWSSDLVFLYIPFLNILLLFFGIDWTDVVS